MKSQEMTNTALLIIDMQEDFFENGTLAIMRENIVNNVNELINIVREADIPVIWIKQEYHPDLHDAPVFNRINNKQITIKGSSGVEILRELQIQKSDKIIIKKRFSAFYKTKLEKLLKKLKIKSLIIAGVNTMTCVRVSVIDAYQRDIAVYLALDCVAAYDREQHENSIKYLQYSAAKGKTNTELRELCRN